MAVTPHITVRVPPEKLDVWRAHCEAHGVDVSTQIRTMMDAWCIIAELEKQAKEMLKVDAS